VNQSMKKKIPPKKKQTTQKKKKKKPRTMCNCMRPFCIVIMHRFQDEHPYIKQVLTHEIRFYSSRY